MGKLYKRSLKIRLIYDHTGFPKWLLWIVPEKSVNLLYKKLCEYQYMEMEKESSKEK